MRVRIPILLKKISDAEYIIGLKSGDNNITTSFFYGFSNYMLNDIRFSLMHNRVDYEDLVNELYIYLSKDNWHKLDTFAGLNGCSLYSWLNRVAWRFFLKRRDYLLGKVAEDVADLELSETVDCLDTEIAIDVEATLRRMNNHRYVQILRWMLIEGLNAEKVAAVLRTSVANVYNIKHRAIVQFIETFDA